MDPVGRQVVEEALAAHRVIRRVGIGFNGQKNRCGGNAWTNHEQDLANPLGGGKGGNVDSALPVVGYPESHRRGPVESVAVSEFGNWRKSAAQVGDLLNETPPGAFMVNEHIVVRSGIRYVKCDFLSLKHTQGAGVSTFPQLPVPGRVLFVVGENVFAFHRNSLFRICVSIENCGPDGKRYVTP